MTTTTTTLTLTAQDITNKILQSKGQFVKVFWKSNPKPAAAYKSHYLEKITQGIVRAGINYANLSSVVQGIANGDRGEVQSLPWGEWKKNEDGTDCFPYIIAHKTKPDKENPDGKYQEYVRLYPSVANKPSSTFYVDSVKVPKETFAKYLTTNEACKILNPKPEDIPLCFTIKVDNILGTPQDIETCEIEKPQIV